MALTTKRIIALPSQSDPQEGDYLAIDNATSGTKKIPVGRIGVEVDDTLTEAGKAADAKAVGDAIDELRTQLEVTGTASGAIATFSDGSDNPMKSCIVNIEPKQSGTGTPSPDNVRQISGWESVNVNVTGKNLLPPKFYSGISYNNSVGTTFTLTDITDTFTETDGVFSKSVSAWGGASMVSEALPNGSYRLNVALTSSGLRLTGYILDADYKVIRQFDLNGSGTSYSENRTITLSDNETYIALYVASSVNGSISFGKPQIEVGTTATEYQPYNPNSHTTTTSLGRTVYGGTVDVVSGVLTVTHGIVDLSTLTWSGSSGIELSADIADTIKPPSANNIPANIIAEKYATSAVAPISANSGKIGAETSGRLQCGSSETPSGALCYELATPQTYQLTPTEIQTLLGENNVWADSGDVEVVYVRDLNLAINNLLNNNGTRSLGMMAMSAPTEATAEEPTDEQSDEDMR